MSTTEEIAKSTERASPLRRFSLRIAIPSWRKTAPPKPAPKKPNTLTKSEIVELFASELRMDYKKKKQSDPVN